VPEQHPDAHCVAVDPRDRILIDAALSRLGKGQASQVATARAPHIAGAEVQARWAQRDFDETGYQATIRPVDVHRQLIAGDHRPFRVCVSNEGTEWWPGGEDRRPLIRTSYRWLTPERDVIEAEGHRTPLPHPLAPGQSCLVEMNITAPPTAGHYMLAPDLVHEHVRWFDCESQPVEMLVVADEAAPL
jgi:hypothetical protein